MMALKIQFDLTLRFSSCLLFITEYLRTRFLPKILNKRYFFAADFKQKYHVITDKLITVSLYKLFHR